MKGLSKEKRTGLILVALGTIALGALLWFFLIGTQLEKLKEISANIEGAQHQQEKIEKAVRNAVQIEVDLKRESKVLASYEEEMASGDLYLWQINMIKNFKGERPVEIPELAAGASGDCSLLPKFPYRQVTLTVGGSAYYQDFGRFVADFENTFPYMRVLNLQMFPKPVQAGPEKEKIAFKMDVVTLAKP